MYLSWYDEFIQKQYNPTGVRTSLEVPSTKRTHFLFNLEHASSELSRIYLSVSWVHVTQQWTAGVRAIRPNPSRHISQSPSSSQLPILALNHLQTTFFFKAFLFRFMNELVSSRDHYLKVHPAVSWNTFLLSLEGEIRKISKCSLCNQNCCC